MPMATPELAVTTRRTRRTSVVGVLDLRKGRLRPSKFAADHNQRLGESLRQPHDVKLAQLSDCNCGQLVQCWGAQVAPAWLANAPVPRHVGAAYSDGVQPMENRVRCSDAPTLREHESFKVGGPG
jgi:hypothetical protein